MKYKKMIATILIIAVALNMLNTVSLSSMTKVNAQDGVCPDCGAKISQGCSYQVSAYDPVSGMSKWIPKNTNSMTYETDGYIYVPEDGIFVQSNALMSDNVMSNLQNLFADVKNNKNIIKMTWCHMPEEAKFKILSPDQYYMSFGTGDPTDVKAFYLIDLKMLRDIYVQSNQRDYFDKTINECLSNYSKNMDYMYEVHRAVSDNATPMVFLFPENNAPVGYLEYKYKSVNGTRFSGFVPNKESMNETDAMMNDTLNASEPPALLEEVKTITADQVTYQTDPQKYNVLAKTPYKAVTYKDSKRKKIISTQNKKKTYSISVYQKNRLAIDLTQSSAYKNLKKRKVSIKLDATAKKNKWITIDGSGGAFSVTVKNMPNGKTATITCTVKGYYKKKGKKKYQTLTYKIKVKSLGDGSTKTVTSEKGIFVENSNNKKLTMQVRGVLVIDGYLYKTPWLEDKTIDVTKKTKNDNVISAKTGKKYHPVFDGNTHLSYVWELSN